MTLDLTDPPRAVLDGLTRAAKDRHSRWRWPVLCTRGAAYPGARMLVLRAFDRTALEIELHTDRRSAKLDELEADPACALLFFDTGSRVQLRLDGQARILTGEHARAAFERAPEGSLNDYRGLPPGADPDGADAAPSDDAAGNFAAIRIALERADLLVIRRDGHDRRFVDFRADPPSWRRAAP